MPGSANVAANLCSKILGSTNGTLTESGVIRSTTFSLVPGSFFEIGPYRFSLTDTSAAIIESILGEWTGEGDQAELEAISGPGTAIDGAIRDDLETLDSCPVLRTERFEGVLVLSPTVARLDDPATLDAIRDRLLQLVAEPEPSLQVVVNLAPLVGLSGRAIGLILAHQLRIQRLGGCLRLAQASASVAVAMDVVGLPSLIEIFPTLDEAVLARWTD